MAAADIYAFENERSTGDYQRKANFVSKHHGTLGKLAIVYSYNTSDEWRQLNAIRTSEVVPIETDTNTYHKLGQNIPKDNLLDALEDSDYNLQSEEVKQAIKQYADYQSQREWVAIAVLGNKIADLSQRNPDIALKLNEGSLRIFMTFGAAHTGLFHNLRKLGLSPTRSFPAKPFKYSHLETAIRKDMLLPQETETMTNS